jgi:hypothetical protein
MINHPGSDPAIDCHQTHAHIRAQMLSYRWMSQFERFQDCIELQVGKVLCLGANGLLTPESLECTTFVFGIYRYQYERFNPIPLPTDIQGIGIAIKAQSLNPVEQS